MEESKIKDQDLKDLDFEILKEGDLSLIRGGTLAAGKPASKNPVNGVLPEACDGLA